MLLQALARPGTVLLVGCTQRAWSEQTSRFRRASLESASSPRPRDRIVRRNTSPQLLRRITHVSVDGPQSESPRTLQWLDCIPRDGRAVENISEFHFSDALRVGTRVLRRDAAERSRRPERPPEEPIGTVAVDDHGVRQDAATLMLLVQPRFERYAIESVIVGVDRTLVGLSEHRSSLRNVVRRDYRVILLHVAIVATMARPKLTQRITQWSRITELLSRRRVVDIAR